MCRMQSVQVFEMLVDAAISSHVIHWLFCKIVSSLLTFPDYPGLGTSCADRDILFLSHQAI